MNTNEHLRSIESTSHRSQEGTSSGAHLEIVRVENVFTRRVEMLSSIEGMLAKPVYVFLAEKILHEREKLMTFIQADVRTIETKKKSIKVLDSNFFVQKSLDINTM